MIAAALAAALAALAAQPADQLREAVARAAAGEPAAAVADLVALADAHPDLPIAADALAKAAEIRDERLLDPAGAAVLWERVLREHPDHRATRRANARLAELRRGLGPDGRHAAAYAAYRGAITRAGAAPDEADIAAVEALLAAADLPFARDARLWIGDAWLRRGALDRAGDSYRQLIAGDDLPARAAAEGLDRIAAAERRAARVRWAWAALLLATALLVALLWRAAGSWPQAGRALLRPPTEIVYLVPVALLVNVVAQSGNRMVAGAVLWIATGGVIVTWLSGSGLDAERSRRGRVSALRALTHALAAAAAIGALAYIAVTRDQLIDLIAETVRFGHEGSP